MFWSGIERKLSWTNHIIQRTPPPINFEPCLAEWSNYLYTIAEWPCSPYILLLHSYCCRLDRTPFIYFCCMDPHPSCYSWMDLLPSYTVVWAHTHHAIAEWTCSPHMLLYVPTPFIHSFCMAPLMYWCMEPIHCTVCHLIFLKPSPQLNFSSPSPLPAPFSLISHPVLPLFEMEQLCYL